MKDEVLLLPVLTLRDTIVFPQVVIPLFVGREKSVNALNHATQNNDCKILLVTQVDGAVDNPVLDDLYKVGIVADVMQLLKLPDGIMKVLIKGKYRAQIINFVEGDSFLQAEVNVINNENDVVISDDVEALRRSVLNEFDIWSKLSKKIQSETLSSIYEIKDLSDLADTIVSHLSIRVSDKQKILETFNVIERLEQIYSFIKLEISILNAQKKIDNRVKSQVETNHRVYYLNEQLKAIQKELEDSEGVCCEIDSASEIEKRIRNTLLSDEAKERAMNDLKRYKKMNFMSPEANIISSYLYWLLDLPWGKYKNSRINMDNSLKILNSNHYGMDKIKERILEFLAVLKRIKKPQGPILCFVGPPGVGKTSLAKSIAEATGREFVRMSLGGVYDESEIRGHRRTYVGAMPGRIIKQIKQAKSCNPLFLLDEIDKVGSDYRGDPTAALLEVLDPEHNKHFVDNYIEVEFDLSNVMFIATANSLNLHKPLLDRMEIIQLSGYTEEEKLKIARAHLIPRLYKDNGLQEKEWSISDNAIYNLIRFYTRESGVRTLKRELASLMRKAVKEILMNKEIKNIHIDNNLEEYMGVQKYTFGLVEKNDMIGMVTGLAYTESGGDILTIESVLMPGKGNIKFTGKLGEVMQESVKAAYSYVRSRCLEFGIKSKKFQVNDIHLHVPEGAIPKDGPSAGIAMCTSIVSLMTGIAVKKTVAMTGEITLRGSVLAIGGLKEKLLAALRSGITSVIIPLQNKKDMIEMPDNVKQGMKFIFVSTVDEVIHNALVRSVNPLHKDDVFIDNKILNTDEEDCTILN
ncbi:endopeptidase La [Neoehrlichia mikurensis]|uniref:Lon protease n=1 Tax=Neoehrlichia mikurensis TaxID=89586 RepID=A0A9Q9BS84_9RICK|nr:endopeptidase La [Neoehrlichia mikurensis]QXK92134.1 endopeptidase La [Neoehrlichia mikurensis]QXK92591.1 endopeptidase La [Neoehrlichia mikurensis]QXK93828.1 endopeptidase La [Neoehrlichia mikurensis]UTO55177.1 endopeptidase La [Neoehrlichia mikurensis]UTO56097.1 endopeptidase La [Neoehrlichia mikurensis]